MVTNAVAGSWAALRKPTFRALWTAQAVSLLATWVYVVGAQWFVVIESGRPELVALVQTASTLPFLFLALPAGAVADLVDRRRLLITVQLTMSVVSTSLSVMAFMGVLTPIVLLGFTVLLGVGTAFTQPAWQGVFPELVSRKEIPSASALNGIAINLARTTGPAIGGLVVAIAGIGWTFAFTAASNIFFMTMVMVRLHTSPRPQGRERLGAAIRLAVNYARNTPAMLNILACTVLWVAPAVALMALLPVVARDQLDLGSRGYGLLLSSVGVGALFGFTLLDTLRRLLSPNQLISACGGVFTVVLTVTAMSHWPALTLGALLVAGATWVTVINSFFSITQLMLPSWIRAREMGVYYIAFQGSQAIGAAIWGAFAGATAVYIALLVAAGCLMVASFIIRFLRLPDPEQQNPAPVRLWEEPQLALEPEEHPGPVLVTVEYRVLPQHVADFPAAMHRIAQRRRRIGARRWRLYRSSTEPDCFLETYETWSWDEHLRQHEQRLTADDQQDNDSIKAMLVGAPVVKHLFSTTKGVSV